MKTGMSLDETISALGAPDRPLLIFGAGTAGEVIKRVCDTHRIRVAAFCDNNINKTGGNLENIPVFHTRDALRKYPDARIIIAVADIHDIVVQLDELGVDQWFPGTTLLRAVNVFDMPWERPADYVEYAVNTCIQCQDNWLSPTRLFLRSADLIITERCTLKCADCSNLMQYYAHPRDCRTGDVTGAALDLCQVVDEINEIRVIGGEPMINKDFHLITQMLAQQEKIKNIVIYTNGTILPRDHQIQALSNNKVLVLITDYGRLSRRKDALVDALARKGIRHFVDRAHGWTNCAGIKKHHRSSKALKALFNACCTKNTFTLSGNKFYRCPFSANLGRLGYIPESPEDVFPIGRALLSGESPRAVKKKLKSFINGMEYLSVCDYCNGRAFDAPQITPARQLKKVRQLDLSNIKDSL